MPLPSEAQFQPATIQASGYTPVVGGNLGGSHLFGGSGQILAGIGQTALEAAKQMQNSADFVLKSPLNPAVKAAQDYQVAQNRAGISHLDYLKGLGPLGQVVQSTTPQGESTMPIGQISDPTTAAIFTGAMGLTPKPGGGGGGPPPAFNNPAVASPQDQGQSDLQQHPENYFLNPATGSYERRSDAPPLQTQPPATNQQKGPPTASDMGKPQASAAPGPSDFQGPDASQVAQGVQQSLSRNQFASSDQGVPAGYQPPNTSGGNIWSPMRPAPLAPSAPNAPAQPPPSQTPAAATQADQVAMQQWQNQNAHPVMSSGDALAWMKNQTTLAQDATYLPMGGPNGSPAYAFHMKGGGQNIVPVSQMIQRGAAPLIAAQNTSAVISQTDQAQQQQAGAQGQPPAPQTPPQQPGTQGQPPAPQNVPPAAPGDYNPAPYRQAVAQAISNPQNLTAQTAPAGQPAVVPGQPINPPPSNTTVSQADQDALSAQAKALGPPPTGKYLGDRPLPGNTGPYTYYVNDDPNSTNRGRVYTTLPGPAGHYFDQKRWYLGTTQYEDYELPDSAARQQMWDKWGQNGFLSRDEINTMPEKEMEPWLQRAWQNEHFQRSSPVEGFNNTLDASEQFHNLVQQAHDIIQTLGDNGYPNLSSLDKMRAAGANAANTLISPRPFFQESPLEHALYPAGEMLRGLVGGMDTTSATAIKNLDQTIDKAQKLVQTHPELLMTPGEGGGQETPNIHIADWVRLGLQNIPASNILSDAAWSGQDLPTRLRTLDALQAVGDARYKSLVSQGQTQWMRIDPKHDANILRIDQGKDLNDPGNLYKDHLFTVDSSDYPRFADKHPNTRFRTTDGQTLRTPQ